MELLNRYNALKLKIKVRKEPFDRFIALLENETTWLTSPASTRFHLSEEQGLLKHSVGVAEMLLRFREFLAPAMSEESCVIVGLFHDAGKLGMPGKPLYLPNDNEWMVKNRGIRYKINTNVVAMGLAVRSIFLVSQYIPLSEAEAQAITYHDGQYIDDNNPTTILKVIGTTYSIKSLIKPQYIVCILVTFVVGIRLSLTRKSH